jgi:hypothetical protein
VSHDQNDAESGSTLKERDGDFDKGKIYESRRDVSDLVKSLNDKDFNISKGFFLFLTWTICRHSIKEGKKTMLQKPIAKKDLAKNLLRI